MNNKRIRLLNEKSVGSGQIVYWMSRDQRVHDNWALIYALQLTSEHKSKLVVVFNLVESFLHAQKRQFYFLLEGLREVESQLAELGIDFQLLSGDPTKTIPEFINKTPTKALICDFSPLKIARLWKTKVASQIECQMIEVDSHNLIPVWETSVKQEYAAVTIRSKIHRLVPFFLDHFPELATLGPTRKPTTNWNALYRQRQLVDTTTWLTPGPNAAQKLLQDFLDKKLDRYNQTRNDPNSNGQSFLSAYLHFGHISAQAIVIEILKRQSHSIEQLIQPRRNGAVSQTPQASLLEELVVRRELAENYCYYNPHYDSFAGFPNWAQTSLNEHRQDKRDFLYTREQFEQASTHDQLWNACQQQLVQIGYIPGYLRMYWAKKILEWTQSPEEAQQIAIYLNDSYQLDGRDPNGYAGIAWSIGGVHDRAWFERPIFGKIRFMSYNGCKTKFNVDTYIQRWQKTQ